MSFRKEFTTIEEADATFKTEVKNCLEANAGSHVGFTTPTQDVKRNTSMMHRFFHLKKKEVPETLANQETVRPKKG